MALPWPHNTPTLPRPVPSVSSPAPARPAGRASGVAGLTDLAARLGTAARRNPRLAPFGTVAANPLTALVVMLVGLALLFVLPLVGLPFVAIVVLPAVIYHLRPERRTALRRPRG